MDVEELEEGSAAVAELREAVEDSVAVAEVALAAIEADLEVAEAILEELVVAAVVLVEDKFRE